MITHKAFSEKIKNKEFAVTLEINSPKGTRIFDELKGIESLIGKIDSLNICDCPMANMRMNPIIMAHMVDKVLGIESIPHYTCRDRNIIALQSDILGGWALGVKNILVITGDAPDKGDHITAKGVFDLDSIGMIKLIKGLNEGYDYNGKTISGPTDFRIGATCNPGADDLDKEINKLYDKIEAGADFIQTQPVYSKATLERFYNKLSFDINIPILVGILPLKSHKMAVNLNDKVPGINIPLKVIERMKKGKSEGINAATELIYDIIDLVDGFHLMPLEDYGGALKLVDSINSIKSRKVG